MTLLTIAVVVIALIMGFLDIPLWVKFSGLAMAVALVLVGLMKDFFSMASEKMAWVKGVKSKYIAIVGLFILLFSANALIRWYEVVWDFSHLRIYSLRQESVEWIKKLSEPVTLHIFLRMDNKTSAYINWLRDSAEKVGDRLKIETHNINRDIALANKYGIRKADEAILESGSRWVLIDDYKETSIVKGLARLFNREKTSICFVTGHGEPDIHDTTSLGISFAAQSLQDVGYAVKTIDIGSTPNISETCSLLVMMGVKSDFFPNEHTQLEALWGHVPFFVLSSPRTPPLLASFLEKRGLKPGGQLVLDEDNLVRHVPLSDVLMNLSESNLGQGTRGSLFMPDTQALYALADQKGWWPVIATSPQQDMRVESDNEHGPFVLVSMYRQNDKGIALVVGSERPFLNVNWRYANNAVVFVQMAQSLIDEEALALPAYGLVEEPLMEMSDYQADWIKNVAMYGFPSVILGLCVLVWGVHRRT